MCITMAAMEEHQAPNEVCIPDNEYNNFMAEVRCLPRNKQHKWHGTLLDKNGTRTKCVFKDGEILNWSPSSRAWVVVKSIEYYKGMIARGAVPKDPPSAVGCAALFGGKEDFTHAFEAEVNQNL